MKTTGSGWIKGWEIVHYFPVVNIVVKKNFRGGGGPAVHTSHNWPIWLCGQLLVIEASPYHHFFFPFGNQTGLRIRLHGPYFLCFIVIIGLKPTWTSVFTQIMRFENLCRYTALTTRTNAVLRKGNQCVKYGAFYIYLIIVLLFILIWALRIIALISH